MSKNIIFLIIAIAVIAGGWLFLRGQNESVTPSVEPTDPEPVANPETPPQNARIVRYTDAGYEPRELTVAVNEIVTFVNESSDTVWTASSPHPAHTNLSAFDEKKESDPGTNYTFTFTEKGTWRYHNHLNPGRTGTIIVK